MLLEFLLEAKSPTKLDLEVESDVESKDSEAVVLAGIGLFVPELFSSLDLFGECSFVIVFATTLAKVLLFPSESTYLSICRLPSTETRQPFSI